VSRTIWVASMTFFLRFFLRLFYVFSTFFLVVLEEARFSRTKQGNALLIDKAGYCYLINRKSERKIYWKCQRKSAKSCRYFFIGTRKRLECLESGDSQLGCLEDLGLNFTFFLESFLCLKTIFLMLSDDIWYFKNWLLLGTHQSRS